MSSSFSGSIVLYKSSLVELERIIKSFTTHDSFPLLYLVDNSPNDSLKVLEKLSDQIIYIHNPTNPGFGVSHNVAINLASQLGISFHFIINPDIHFNMDVINPMITYMQNNHDVGMMMPKILNSDGSVQNLPKLLPQPFSILWRKIRIPKIAYERFIDKYELRFAPEGKIYNAPILSGCFTLLNMKAIKEIGLYDDRFFMYFEDWDLSRRMHYNYRTIYFPLVSVYHGYESGANKSIILFKIFIKSAIHYFNKWGWFFDKDRKKINRNTLLQFQR